MRSFRPLILAVRLSGEDLSSLRSYSFSSSTSVFSANNFAAGAFLSYDAFHSEISVLAASSYPFNEAISVELIMLSGPPGVSAGSPFVLLLSVDMPSSSSMTF